MRSSSLDTTRSSLPISRWLYLLVFEATNPPIIEESLGDGLLCLVLPWDDKSSWLELLPMKLALLEVRVGVFSMNPASRISTRLLSLLLLLLFIKNLVAPKTESFSFSPSLESRKGAFSSTRLPKFGEEVEKEESVSLRIPHKFRGSKSLSLSSLPKSDKFMSREILFTPFMDVLRPER